MQLRSNDAAISAGRLGSWSKIDTFIGSRKTAVISSPRHILSKLTRIASEPSLHFFEQATLIADLHQLTPSIADLPDQSGMSRRRLYYLLEVGRLIRDRDISKAQAEKVGWTKMKTIARHLARSEDVSDETVEKCLSLALNNSARALPAALEGEEVEATRSAVFHLTPDQRSELEEALVAFGAERTPRGLVNKEEALRNLVRTAVEQIGPTEPVGTTAQKSS